MSKPSHFQLALIADYLAGKLSADQQGQLEAWISEDSATQELVATLRASQKLPGSHVPDNVAEHQSRIENISERLLMHTGHKLQDSENASTSSAPGHKSSIQRRYSSWAAVLFATVIIAIGGIASGIFDNMLNSADADTGQVSPAMAAYTTGAGERATITLPDGSVVSLNVASTIRVPVDYGSSNRTLYLTGEALFTVSHKSGAPFSVIAGPGVVKVLGTQFSVRNYPSDSIATIAVRDGRVSVSSTTLTAGQSATVAENGQVALGQVEGGQFTFANGVLTLEERPLKTVISELNRWYNADIRLGDIALGDRYIHGQFTAGSITDLIAILKLTLDIRVEHSGRTLTLYLRD